MTKNYVLKPIYNDENECVNDTLSQRASISRINRMDNGPPDQDQTRAQISCVITVQIEPWWEHPDRRITI